ncbi:MAG: hypothetical protein ACD_49C00088G0003 [uncultured bacterium (gcode 4)]|uniref:Uncharacterized protein n=1 Tax=uncultured bacterium (gcode 4) TaxID=1234023 RepID=K2BAL9_9BACT|nr:MAG: hypothetical protein ACD_49C00088G0003 [uncultured bacterium (gcode 4)]
MNYTTSHFRANMGEILDKTKYNRTFTTIWRRNKTEFFIIPIDVLKEKWLEKEFQIEQNYKDNWYYQNIETSLNKVWENDNTLYSISDLQNV